MELLQNIQHRIFRLTANLVLEQPAKRRGMDRLLQSLESSGQALEKRALAASGLPRNQQVLAHIIGIERWGQRRMRVALGEPLEHDDYDPYRPAARNWPDLLATFNATRQATIGLARSLRMAGVDPLSPVLHNQFGPLSLLGWLYYLHLHAWVESQRIH